jgi:cystathionine beta-lyase
VLPRAELEAVADLCAEHDAWVIADEIHAPLTLPGCEHVPFLEVSPAAREHGIAVTSASKAYNLAALKCGLVVTASDRARAAVAAMPPQADHTGLLGVLASEVAFTACDEWLDGVIATLARNREILATQLAHTAGIRWIPPGASYLAWLDCREAGLEPHPAAALLRDGRLAVSPGHDYGPPGRGFVRLNFGTSSELVKDMAERIHAALAKAFRN